VTKRALADALTHLSRPRPGVDIPLPELYELDQGVEELMSVVDRGLDHLEAGDLRYPFARMVNSGDALPETAYSWTRYLVNASYLALNPVAVAELWYGAAATLILQGMERWTAEGEAFARTARDLTRRVVDLNCYITPANCRAFDPHYDPQDVLLVQLEGTKVWDVYDPVHSNPHLTDYYAKRDSLTQGDSARLHATYCLEPGLAVYIPRGFGHSGRAGQGGSVHVTIGMLVESYPDVIARTALSLLSDPLARRESRSLTDEERAALLGTLTEALALEAEDAVGPAVTPIADRSAAGGPSSRIEQWRSLPINRWVW
jgi:hypothetical protein